MYPIAVILLSHMETILHVGKKQARGTGECYLPVKKVLQFLNLLFAFIVSLLVFNGMYMF